MKTLADLKRRLVVGTPFTITHATVWANKPTGQPQPRIVLTAGPSVITSAPPDQPDKKIRLEYGPSTEWTVNGDTATWTDPHDPRYFFTIGFPQPH